MRNIYNALLLLIAGATHKQLTRQVASLKVENKILRALRFNCVLSIDFWAHGVLLVLNGDDLEQIKMNRPRE